MAGYGPNRIAFEFHRGESGIDQETVPTISYGQIKVIWSHLSLRNQPGQKKLSSAVETVLPQAELSSPFQALGVGSYWEKQNGDQPCHCMVAARLMAQPLSNAGTKACLGSGEAQSTCQWSNGRIVTK